MRRVYLMGSCSHTKSTEDTYRKEETRKVKDIQLNEKFADFPTRAFEIKPIVRILISTECCDKDMRFQKYSSSQNQVQNAAYI